MDPILSSPSRQGFNQYLEGTEVILRVSNMEQADLTQIRLAAKEAQKRKEMARKYTVGKGPITISAGLKAIKDKNARVAKRKPKKSIETIRIEDDDEVDSGSDVEFSKAVMAGMAGDGIPDPFSYLFCIASHSTVGCEKYSSGPCTHLLVRVLPRILPQA